MQKINLIHLKDCPILDQLKLEEALLRADDENFCIINEGSSQDAIVMGISSKVKDHLHAEKVKEKQIAVIKRFSGGGTVVVDANTFFVTFIFNKKDVDISPFPEPILRWSEAFYQGVFHSEFSLRENDYVFKDKKFGGNAKYIQKDRWLLHTSFLWDYSQEKMDLLQNPEKAPQYRKKRSHDEFLTKLNIYYNSQEELAYLVIQNLKEHFKLNQTYNTYPEKFLNGSYRKSTTLLDL